ncbi:tyrosine-type recombinase/integrase [Aestuariimicrobium sp. Y1814]|uniref:tyrosine-type recombinase/integrase n=1 Tax=Aestuariimicrobium sp. Y1814 TaxID=3418742 RepID=UPI003DA71BEB
MTPTNAARWDAALTTITPTLASHYSPATRDRLLKDLRRFAREVDTSPWLVAPGHVDQWLEQFTGRQLYVYRTSLRTFYRWALNTGRVTLDPTAHVDGRERLKRKVSAKWHASISAWIDYLRAASAAPATVRVRRKQLQVLAAECPVTDPWQVSAADLVEWQAGHRWARETARSYRSAVTGFYAWALRSGFVLESPADGLPVVRQSPPMPRPSPEWAYAKALEAAYPREALMLRLSAELGLRRGEVARVHTRDVVATEDGWSLVVHGKGNRDRLLPLPESIAVQLHTRAPGHVFAGQVEGHLSPDTVGKLVSALLPPGVTMHQLRHRFATKAYAVDRDVLTVQQLLGHASAATTQRYVQLPDHAMRRLVDQVATHSPRSPQ